MSRSDSELDTQLAGVLFAALRQLPVPQAVQPLDEAAVAARLADTKEPHHDQR